MKKIKTIFILLISILILCNSTFKNKGLYDFQYDSENKKIISNIKTYFDGLVYIKNKNKIIKIFPNSSLELNNSNDFLLKEGIILTYENNLKSRKLLEKSDIDIKVFLDNQIGKAQFYRLSLPVFLKDLNFEVRIDYYVGNEIKSINTKSHLFAEDNNYNYYGFFVPLSMYLEFKKYSVNINIFSSDELIGQIITNHEVYPKRWEVVEEQYITFNRTKSKEIMKFDREKYENEKKERNEIWLENNYLMYFLSGFINPINEIKYITSEFGLTRIQKYSNGKIFSKNIHDALDLAKDLGTPIYAPSDGIVRYAKMVEIYGNMVIIEHGFSFFTDYGHLNEIFVKPGQIVKKGDIIGTVGSTGWSTGAHLHWGAKLNGISIDPRSFFSIEDVLIP